MSVRQQDVKYKRFKVAAHNLGRSFTSTPNLASLDHTMSYLTHCAVAAQEPVFSVNLLSGAVVPEALNAAPVNESVRHYVRWFPRLIAQEGLAFRSIQAASMTIVFDLASKRTTEGGGGTLEVDFKCTVSITDDRDVANIAEFQDTWHGGPRAPRYPRRFWWQFWRPAA
jgi:hypothetical protein